MESGLDLNNIRDIVKAKVILSEKRRGSKKWPRFTQKLVPLYTGYAWMPDPDFSITDHVIPMPSTIRTKRDLESYVGMMGNKTLSKERPLWEMQVLTDFGDCKDTVVLLRIHPCMTDGWALMHILVNALADNPVTFLTKPHYGVTTFLLNLIRALVIGPVVFLQKWIFTRRDYNVYHGALKLSGQKSVAWSEPFSLQSAIRIKKVTRSTMNDILLTISAGVIRQHMQGYGVDNPYDMLALIPMDLRTSKKTGVNMGTHYCYSEITLPTNTEGTIPRLWEIKHQTEDIKNSAGKKLGKNHYP